MGRTTTPKYRLVVVVDGQRETSAWDSHYGRPTEANIAKYVDAYVKSMYPGGANEHISKAIGHVPVPSSAQIIRQKDNESVAEWKAPMFMVLPTPRHIGGRAQMPNITPKTPKLR